jgi:hypothetical protein
VLMAIFFKDRNISGAFSPIALIMSLPRENKVAALAFDDPLVITT